jgi:hypothetical protein
MTTLLTTALIDRCHAGSRAKGFWDETPPQGQQLMLVISELAEALEAHRKGKKSTALPPALVAHFVESMGNPKSAARELFENTVKDTPGDELADAYIRLCDFAAGFGQSHGLLSWYNDGEYSYTLNPNFGGALFQLTRHVRDGLKGWETIDESQLAEACCGIEALCKREGIDLATHIDLKLRYNATRPDKHGKAY